MRGLECRTKHIPRVFRLLNLIGNDFNRSVGHESHYWKRNMGYRLPIFNCHHSSIPINEWCSGGSSGANQRRSHAA